jgi:hypothetical protein
VNLLSFGWAIIFGPLISVVAIGAMVASIYIPSPLWAGLSMFLFGVGPTVWVINTVTLRQAVTPGGLLGRVSALFLTVNAGARPIGAALGGAIGALYGPTSCIVVAAIGFLVQVTIIICSPIRELKHLPSAQI